MKKTRWHPGIFIKNMTYIFTIIMLIILQYHGFMYFVLKLAGYKMAP